LVVLENQCYHPILKKEEIRTSKNDLIGIDTHAIKMKCLRFVARKCLHTTKYDNSNDEILFRELCLICLTNSR
jgi:hypothetical protein